MSCEQLVKFYKSKDLSGDDIVELTGKSVVIYSDLKKYKNIESLLGKENYTVLLYQTSAINTGHYVALFIRFDGTLCFCDSYGYAPDSPQQLGLTPFDEKLPRYLTTLIDKWTSSGKKFEYSKYDYQSKSPGIAVCGRYASFMVKCGRHMTFREIERFLTQNQSAFLTPDSIITLLTLFTLHEIRSFFDNVNR